MDTPPDSFGGDNVEKGASWTAAVVYNSRGLPVVPQPSDDPLDPLNWSAWLKLVVLLEVSMLSFLSLFNASLITPNFQPLSVYLHRSLTETAYITSVFIATLGIASVIWNPLSNVYGRRPLYLLSIVMSIATSIGSGASKSYGELMVFRALSGLFGGISLSIGNATVCEMYFEHTRGFYMGIYTLSLITGGHVAPIIGGYIEKSTSWRWCFYIPAIIMACLLPVFALTVPETLYPRSSSTGRLPYQSWRENMMMRTVLHPRRKLEGVDFLRPLQMLQYPSILLPMAYYATCFTYGSVLFIITSANLFGQVYHFVPYQTGLLLGIPLTAGSIVGELISGALSDYISNARASARGAWKPEDRLIALVPAVVLLPLGVIIEGVSIQKRLHWIGAGMGIGIASCGCQTATTIVYTYTLECYRQQATEIGCLLNFSRQMFSFCVGFYAVPLGDKINYENAWIVFAMINVALALPMLGLYYRGERWRHVLGAPDFHRDL